MNKPVILTVEGIKKIEKEIDDVESNLIMAKKDLKTAKLWGTDENISLEKSTLKNLKKKHSSLKTILETAIRV